MRPGARGFPRQPPRTPRCPLIAPLGSTSRRHSANPPGPLYWAVSLPLPRASMTTSRMPAGYSGSGRHVRSTSSIVAGSSVRGSLRHGPVSSATVANPSIAGSGAAEPEGAVPPHPARRQASATTHVELASRTLVLRRSPPNRAFLRIDGSDLDALSAKPLDRGGCAHQSCGRPHDIEKTTAAQPY